MKLIMKALVMVMILLLPGINAVAESAFPPGLLIGDNDGIHVTSEGKYFIYADDMKAGDVIQKTLTISNTENSTFTLTMTADPLDQTGPIELLDKIKLRLTLDGKQIYNGRVYGDDGNNMILNALQLGRYSFGDRKTMKIELSLDKNIPKSQFMQKSIAEVRWNFYAVKDDYATPPKTGEEINQILMASCTALIGVALILFYKSQRKSEKKTNHRK